MEKILIYGVKSSGKALYRLLVKNNQVFLFDDDKNALKDYPKQVVYDVGDDIAQFDKLLISPSVNPSNSLVKKARDCGVKVLNEFEFSFFRCKADGIYVTGTDGKTTTVSMIENIFKQTEKRFFTVGNIGNPFADCCDKIKKDDLVVGEVSSFMLDGFVGISPHIAAVLNVFPDHIDRHKTIENYSAKKFSICKNMSQKDIFIINADDELTKRAKIETKAKILSVSLCKKTQGAYVDSKSVYADIDGIKTKLFEVENLKLNGLHNLYNAMFAALSCFCYGILPEYIRKGISEFCGVPHRQQIVAQKGSVIFANDSKATTPHATLAAIHTFKEKNIGLILGGSDKMLNLSEILDFGNVYYYAFVGQTAGILKSAADKKNLHNYVVCDDLHTAVNFLYKKLKNIGGVILLSPACASFDKYKDYRERGEDFVRAVKELL